MPALHQPILIERYKVGPFLIKNFSEWNDYLEMLYYNWWEEFEKEGTIL